MCRTVRLTEQRWSNPALNLNTVGKAINLHQNNILNYFDNRGTNASAESFDARIDAFRAESNKSAIALFIIIRTENHFTYDGHEEKRRRIRAIG
ncbi:transposase [Arcticibacter sp. MXS-1]|uniref:transposase n=1 Tax=Arcticibacter sp. MXS-1 TaxID=3341726 RepID=UPI0035A88583